jgi:predicted transcriptional regulator
VISSIVYLLCAFTSIACASLLYLKYRRKQTRLLFWCAVCFFGLALNNILLVVDLVLTPPTFDLFTIRAIPAALGFAALATGLAWETP